MQIRILGFLVKNPMNFSIFSVIFALMDPDPADQNDNDPDKKDHVITGSTAEFCLILIIPQNTEFLIQGDRAPQDFRLD
jgi:hypothetical protein